MPLNPSWPVSLLTVPTDIIGPRILRALPTLVAVTGGAGATVDLSQDATAGNLPVVQAVYLDTSKFNYTLTVTHRATGFPVTVKAATQGWYPIAATDGLLFDVLAPAGAVGLAPPIWFCNVAMPAMQWATA